MRLLALTLAATLLLAACGDDGAQAPPPADGAGDPGGAAGGTQPHDDELASITGIFGADAELEGGCAWVETDGQRYEVAWPEGYSVDFAADPVALVGPGGEVVAEAGERVMVEGSVNADAVTVCQIGPLFEGTSVTADAGDLPA